MRCHPRAGILSLLKRNRFEEGFYDRESVDSCCGRWNPHEIRQAQGCPRGTRKPLVRWVVDAAHDAGIEDVVTVLGHMSEKVAPLVEDDTKIAIQTQQLGTAMP